MLLAKEGANEGALDFIKTVRHLMEVSALKLTCLGLVFPFPVVPLSRISTITVKQKPKPKS